MRLFTALDLPGEIMGKLEELIQQLRPAARIRWSPPANLHVTTKFIGEWPSERLDELKSELGALPGRLPIKIHIQNLGFFPNAHAPRIFWCGIDAPGLAALAADTDSATATLGVEREARPFSPHLTLARIKEPLNMDPLTRRIAALPSTDFGTFEARSFFLYLSQMQSGGSVYTKLAEFPLLP
jgi:RNA 2',3'-cyclic 3'-phosphodiesterase